MNIVIIERREKGIPSFSPFLKRKKKETMAWEKKEEKKKEPLFILQTMGRKGDIPRPLPGEKRQDRIV